MAPFKPVAAGTQFGRLVVVRDRPRGSATVDCACECGAEVSPAFRDLSSGHTQSCGCRVSQYGFTQPAHGMHGTDIYWVWADMIARCNRETHHAYERYGGRGIVVCERWMVFANFYADMGLCPDREHSLDREDNDGPYSPENCRWATLSEQASNRRPFANPRDESGRFVSV